jgi:hypothetical protein
MILVPAKLYLNARRRIRNRPEFYGSHRGKKTYKGDLKKNSTDEILEASSYDVVSLHIPYGPGWHAKRIEKLVYQTVRGSEPRQSSPPNVSAGSWYEL